MSVTPSRPSEPPLWTCHACKQIGSEAHARAHAEETGHDVEQVPQDQSDAVREAWNELRAKRVVELIAAAAFMKDQR